MGFFHGVAIAGSVTAALISAPGALSTAAQHVVDTAQAPAQVAWVCPAGGPGLLVDCAEAGAEEGTEEGTEEGAEGLPLTDDEQTMLALMDPKDRARYLLQKRVQETAELGALLGQLQSLRHDTA